MSDKESLGSNVIRLSNHADLRIDHSLFFTPFLPLLQLFLGSLLSHVK